jgi:hypothetical protein
MISPDNDFEIIVSNPPTFQTPGARGPRARRSAITSRTSRSSADRTVLAFYAQLSRRPRSGCLNGNGWLVHRGGGLRSGRSFGRWPIDGTGNPAAVTATCRGIERVLTFRALRGPASFTEGRRRRGACRHDDCLFCKILKG